MSLHVAAHMHRSELRDEEAVTELCMSTPPLRDELFLQVCAVRACVHGWASGRAGKQESKYSGRPKAGEHACVFAMGAIISLVQIAKQLTSNRSLCAATLGPHPPQPPSIFSRIAFCRTLARTHAHTNERTHA